MFIYGVRQYPGRGPERRIDKVAMEAPLCMLRPPASKALCVCVRERERERERERVRE